ncbi:MAG TPA: hypothetical protein VFU31_10675 [Candidatus Binatia bacterium]|nr:hypothetical protein [Candidatus Binatia bacterium]
MKPKPSAVEPEIFLKYVRKDYLEAIGLVITQWSLMESMLDSCIWRAADLRNDLGRVISTQLQIQSKLDTLTTLLRQTRPELAGPMAKVSDFVRTCLQGQRNLAAHGMWSALDSPLFGFGKDTPAFVVKFTARGKLVSQGGEIPIDQLHDLARDIAEVSSWLSGLGLMLPELKKRQDGPGHSEAQARNRVECAKRKKNALQPLP